MNCPNCGAETDEAVCPVCGATVSGEAGGFKLAGAEQPEAGGLKLAGEEQPKMGNPFGGQPQQEPGVNTQAQYGETQYNGASQFAGNQYGGAPQYQGDPMQNGYAEDPYGMPAYNQPAYQQPPKKKSGVGVVVGIIVAFAVFAAVIIFLFSGSIGGAKKSKELIDQFMTGIEEADTDKIVSLVDKDCVGDNDVETLSSSFELLKSMDIEYSVDYKITSTEKANRATIKNMCEGIYNDESVAGKVKCAYICDVDYSITMSYLGETETQDDKMSLICYKKGGKWYIGGTVESEED